MRTSIAAPLALAAVFASFRPATPSPPPLETPRIAAPGRVDGQWIWTRQDADIFARSARADPARAAGVLVASVEADGLGRLELRRGLSPGIAGVDTVALVVRLEDSVHRAWDERGARGLALDLDRLLGQVLAEARATKIGVSEIELDYDAPARRLADWAEVLGVVARSSLDGVPLWVTSVPSHLGDPDHGARLSGSVAGHVLQLFDTGLPCSDHEIRRLRARLERHALPFRLGVAVFERAHGGKRTTDHACWARSARAFSELSGYAGEWRFVAGQSESLARFEVLP